MAAADPIPPFPADIDRRDFGHYIAGLADGEGHFGLRYSGAVSIAGCWKVPNAIFTIGLRDDDADILRLAQSFFGCGCIDLAPRRCDFRIHRARELAAVVIPHFDTHPLRAKKARDYQVWREGVQLIHRVTSMPRRRTRGQRGGLDRRWTEDTLDHFSRLHAALKAVRQYSAVSA